jgi:hypothetical protein
MTYISVLHTQDIIDTLPRVEPNGPLLHIALYVHILPVCTRYLTHKIWSSLLKASPMLFKISRFTFSRNVNMEIVDLGKCRKTLDFWGQSRVFFALWSETKSRDFFSPDFVS